MTLLKHSIFIIFFVLQIAYGLLCVFGPFIARTNSVLEDFFKYSLVVSVVMGPMLTVDAYIKWIFGEDLPRFLKWIMSNGLLDLVTKKYNLYQQPWVCLVAPGFLMLSFLLTGLFFLSSKVSKFIQP